LVNVTITNNNGYMLRKSQTISVNTGANQNAIFNWNTIGLSAEEYYFDASVTIADDANISDNNFTTQQNLLPPPDLSIISNLDKTSYSEGEQILLTVTTEVNATVTFLIKNSSDSVVKSGSATDPEDDGSYNSSFNAPLLSGEYTIEVTGTKIGYLPGVVASVLTVNDTKPPTTPILVSPPHGIFITNPLPIMDWNESTDAGSGIASYEIEIDDNSDFSSPIVQANPTTSSYTVTIQLQDGAYYWRVRAKDDAGNPTDSGEGWAIPFRFTVDTENPVVTITSPTSEPTYETETSPITISGVASDGGGLSIIAINTGDINNGTLENWSFPVDLVEGTNPLTISATDISGNVESDVITVNYILSEPNISVSPPSNNFGDVPVGGFSEQGFVVLNNGNVTLQVSTSSIEGPDADQFSIENGNGAFNLEPANTHNITVRFSPISTGAKNAILRISSNDPDEAQKDVSLSGNGKGPIFVDQDATGPNDGSSWENAYTELQNALAASQTDDAIWVAEGIYVPGAEREHTFQLIEGAALYGGFNGTETSRDERDWTTNETILSGDINGDDDGFTNNDENVYHVVTGANDATIDGFTITGGNADGDSHPDHGGGGIYNSYSNTIINNCILSWNSASHLGSGIRNWHSSPIIDNCIFTRNKGHYGGGIQNDYSAPTIKNCIISDNEGNYGGGINNKNTSNPIIENCIVSGNDATIWGGGIYNTSSSAPIITNCTIYGNNAFSNGGGICNNENVSLTVTNCILWENTAGLGDEISNNNSISTVSYSDIAGGISGIFNENGGSVIDGEGNIDEDPLFVNSATGDFHLQLGSPCIDAGDPVEMLTVGYITGDMNLEVGSVTNISVGDTIWITDRLNTESEVVSNTSATTITVVSSFINNYLVPDDAYVYTQSSDFSDEPEPNGGRINIGNYGGTIEATTSSISNIIYELAVDFAANGLWHYNGTTWTQLIGQSPEAMEDWDGGLAADFAASGLWNYSGSSWNLLISLDPEAMKAWDDGLVVDFGSSGLWYYTGSSWDLLTTNDPQGMESWADGLAVDFGAAGLWNYDGLIWSLLTNIDAQSIKAWANGLAVDFGTVGLWSYNGSSWTQLAPNDAQSMVAWSGGLAVNFDTIGLWNYNGSAWSLLTDINAEYMVAWAGGLAVDFGVTGLFSYDGLSWDLLTIIDPQDLEGWGTSLAVDLGSSGLWSYDGSAWSQLTTLDSEDMIDVDLF